MYTRSHNLESIIGGKKNDFFFKELRICLERLEVGGIVLYLMPSNICFKNMSG
jgi:hypothetical protein